MALALFGSSIEISNRFKINHWFMWIQYMMCMLVCMYACVFVYVLYMYCICMLVYSVWSHSFAPLLRPNKKNRVCFSFQKEKKYISFIICCVFFRVKFCLAKRFFPLFSIFHIEYYLWISTIRWKIKLFQINHNYFLSLCSIHKQIPSSHCVIAKFTLWSGHRRWWRKRTTTKPQVNHVVYLRSHGECVHIFLTHFHAQSSHSFTLL